ncbi:hypothetical protein O3G_MSEX011388 [Manduca sexta]|uniref:Uncharacterized protein n=1 Tax=Manduca sexta TaxID=7130 RepID=A0A921ZL03_MANSE|nr:hypothetical protein O3G_MSEX011388 [Manduca sexta]
MNTNFHYACIDNVFFSVITEHAKYYNKLLLIFKRSKHSNILSPMLSNENVGSNYPQTFVTGDIPVHTETSEVTKDNE